MFLKLCRLEFIRYWSPLATVKARSNSSLVWSQVINSVPFRNRCPFTLLLLWISIWYPSKKRLHLYQQVSVNEDAARLCIYCTVVENIKIFLWKKHREEFVVSRRCRFCLLSCLGFVWGLVVSAQPLPPPSTLTVWFLPSIHPSLCTDWLSVSQLQPMSPGKNLSV